jgi:hypothetical protein
MRFHALGTIAATCACVGMILPGAAWAATPATATGDVALRSGGLLLGQVVDQQGVAKAGMPVSIQFAGKEVVSTTTDVNGVFAAQGLRGGAYQVVTPQSANAYRLWAADTAPPSARPAALVVSGNEVVRGQGPMSSWVNWVKCHPYITAGTVAAAVAIPLALAADDSDNGS